MEIILLIFFFLFTKGERKFLSPECCSALSHVKDTGRCRESGSQPDVNALSLKQLETLPMWSRKVISSAVLGKSTFLFGPSYGGHWEVAGYSTQDLSSIIHGCQKP